MQPLSGNQRPDLLTALMNMSLVLRLPRKMHLCRSSSNVPGLPSFLEMLQNPHVLLTFDKVHNPLRLPRKTTLQRPKVARTCGALYILTSKCASCHNGVHFFDISTSKSRLNVVCFLYILTWKCASRYNGVHLLHITTSKSGRNLLCFVHFVHLYILTWKCASHHNGVHFFDITASKSCPVRRWCVLYILTWKCASRHNGVQCFISHLASWLRTRRFAALASLLFDPPEPQIIGKTQCFATFLPFRAPGSSETFSFLIFFHLLFSSLTLPISAFHLSILSEV